MQEHRNRPAIKTNSQVKQAKMQLERLVSQTHLGDYLEYSIFPSPGQWKGPIVWIYYLGITDLKKPSVLHVYVRTCFHVQVSMQGYTHACGG